MIFLNLLQNIEKSSLKYAISTSILVLTDLLLLMMLYGLCS